MEKIKISPRLGFDYIYIYLSIEEKAFFVDFHYIKIMQLLFLFLQLKFFIIILAPALHQKNWMMTLFSAIQDANLCV